MVMMRESTHDSQDKASLGQVSAVDVKLAPLLNRRKLKDSENGLTSFWTRQLHAKQVWRTFKETMNRDIFAMWLPCDSTGKSRLPGL